MENFDINKMIKAAKAGGEVIRKYFGETLEIVEKSTIADIKTQADSGSEAAVMDSLGADFPEANIHAEESGTIDKGSDYTFVIDPLDGTNNFVLDMPLFCVSIGLLKDGQIIAGVIYNPILDQVYRAELGQGAFCNDRPIHVSEETFMERSTVGYSCGYINIIQDYLDAYDKLDKKKVKRVTLNWSPTVDFCLLASGKTEAFIVNKNELHDFAAGKLIVREAGGLICNLDGTPEQSDTNDRFLMANNAQIQKEVLECIKFIRSPK